MTGRTNEQPDSATGAVDRKLAQAWRKERRLCHLVGLACFLLAAVMMALLDFILDWSLELPGSARVALAAANMVVMAGVVYVGWWRRLKPFDAVRLALRVERKHPDLRSLLVSCVQFGMLEEDSPGAVTAVDLRSSPLTREVRRQAAQATAPLDFRRVVPSGKVRWPVALAAFAVIAFGVFGAWRSDLLAVAAGRLLDPSSDMQYPTRTHLSPLTGDMVVKQGDSATVRILASGEVPAAGILRVARTGGNHESLEMPAGEAGSRDGAPASEFAFTFPAVYEDFEYSFAIGDAKSRLWSVRSVPPPTIVRTQVSLEPPPYTKLPADTFATLNIRSREGTRIRWELTMDRPLGKAQFVQEGAEPVDMTLRDGGKTATITRAAAASTAYHFVWTDRDHPFIYEGARNYIEVIPDTAPRAAILQPTVDLKAVLDLKLPITYWAKDDCGLAQAWIAYSINGGEESLLPLASPDGTKEIESAKIDWSPGAAMELKEGDILTYAVVVSDSYDLTATTATSTSQPATAPTTLPWREGHVGRSKPLHVQFLSAADYMADVMARRSKFLAQIRPMYMQERQALAHVAELRAGMNQLPTTGPGQVRPQASAPAGTDVSDDAGNLFLQNVLLEAARQEVVNQRLAALAGEFHGLIQELQANRSPNGPLETELGNIMGRLESVRSTHVAAAQNELRAVLTEPARMTGLVKAEEEIQKTVRELGSLMLRASIAHATEVFIDELCELIAAQENLRLETLAIEVRQSGIRSLESGATAETARKAPATSAPKDSGLQTPDSLSQRQKALADRVISMIAEFKDVEEAATTDPVASIRLARTRKLVESENIAGLMTGAADDLGALEPFFDKATAKQASALKALRQAWYKLELGAELQALVAARARLTEALNKQKALRRQIELLTPEQYSSQSKDLLPTQRELQGILARVNSPLPIDSSLTAAESAHKTACEAIASADKPRTAAAQIQVEEALTEGIRLLNDRIADLQKMDAVYRQLQAAMERLKVIRDMELRQQQILDATEAIVGTTEQDKPITTAPTSAPASVAHLEQPQERLATEVKQLSASLSDAGKWTPVLRRPLASAVQSMGVSGEVLRGNKASAALPAEGKALAALGDAGEIELQEIAALERQWRLLRTISDLRMLAKYLKDIEDEQRDVRQDTEKATSHSKDVGPLAKPQNILAQAVAEIAETLGAMEGTASIQDPVAKAQTAMTDATGKLQASEGSPAVGLQKQAEKLLQDAQKEAMSVADQNDLLAEWTVALEKIQINILNLLQRQIALRKETELAKVEAFPELSGEQDILKAEAESFAVLLEYGRSYYEVAAKEMGLAMTGLTAKDRKDAVMHMVLAEEALSQAGKELAKLMENLETVPGMMTAPSEEMGLAMKAMILAAKQRNLRYQARPASQKDLPALASPQDDLQKQTQELVGQAAENQDLLEEAAKEMTQATGELKKPARDEAVNHQQLAEKALRKFILETVLKAFKLPEKMAMSVSAPGGVIALDMESLHVFVKSPPEGDAPARGKSGWDPLGKRDRAALKQNFARELPLEYREFFKQYYEALSRPE